MSYKTDRDEFVHILTKEGADLPTIEAVLRLSQTYQRLQIQDCNVGLTDVERARVEAYEGRLTDTLRLVRMRPVFSGDPRGVTVKIQVPSGKTNDLGNVGICVPVKG